MNKLVISSSADKKGKGAATETKLYSAIDTAIENNQIRAVSLIIDHIVNYQDSYVSYRLFSSNFLDLMRKGLTLTPLLCSNIFYKKLEFEDWPTAHTDLEKMLVPYSGSLFEMRHSYDEIFPGLGDPMNEEENVKDSPDGNQEQSASSNKYYSITYKVNLLPSVIYNDETGEVRTGELLESIQDQGENELEIFEAKVIQDLIDYKWNNYAYFLHYLGAGMHLFYIIAVTYYVYTTYLTGVYGQSDELFPKILLCLGILYPFIYDSIQLYKQKWDYFKDPWNYSDMAFNWSGICNLFFQFTGKPDNLSSQITMTILLMFALVKSLFFLRIFDSLSYLVTLLRGVIYDLRIFMLFYAILMFMFSLMIGVLGLGNFSRDPELVEGLGNTRPGIEYQYIGQFIGNMVHVVRMSIGDNDFSASIFLEEPINILFWIVWIIIMFIMCIIFLNFIIAEASASYEKVCSNIDYFLLFQKVNLIYESEEMMPASQRTLDRFPKYIVARERED